MKDSLVRCDRCGNERRVSFAVCLGSGWPKCHGYTMRLVETKADIGRAVEGHLQPAAAAVDELLRRAG